MALRIDGSSNSLNLTERLVKEREEKSEKLASAKHINNAADDAAGLQISERLTSQINGYQQLSANVQDQANVNSIQEGQLSSISESLQRANVLSIQSGNPLSDNTVIQEELDQLTEQVNTIAGEVLGDDNFLSGLDASDPATTQAALETAFETINQSSADLGAESNALLSQSATYETTRVSVSESRSRIEDTDFAKTTAEKEQTNTLLQSAIISKKDENGRKGLLINKLI